MSSELEKVLIIVELEKCPKGHERTDFLFLDYSKRKDFSDRSTRIFSVEYWCKSCKKIYVTTKPKRVRIHENELIK